MQAVIEQLRELVRIPSVIAEPEENMPFGKAIDRCLDEMLRICREMGLETYKDPAGYYGYAQVGSGEAVFGVLCHLDVVPAGTLSEWQHPPFELHLDEEAVYGRGVSDDKGPTLVALHALMDLLKAGKTLKMPVRFIFGLDEETHWRCIDKYKADGQLIPVMGFTPDSDFPLAYAEKGLWQVNLCRMEGDALRLEGGVAYNVVPGEAFYEDSEPLQKALHDLNFHFDLQDGRLRVIGENVHASIAPEGKNALVGLMTALHRMGADSEACRFVAEKLYDGVYGDTLFSVYEDEASGHMTVNLGMVKLTDQEQKLCLDIRHPVTLDIDQLRAELREQASRYGYTTEDESYIPPIYLQKDSDLILKLMQAYQAVTGDMESEPEIMGGATFARSMDNVVAYGAMLPGQGHTAHQANEKVTLHNMQEAYKIYQRAFEMLIIKE